MVDQADRPRVGKLSPRRRRRPVCSRAISHLAVAAPSRPNSLPNCSAPKVLERGCCCGWRRSTPCCTPCPTRLQSSKPGLGSLTFGRSMGNCQGRKQLADRHLDHGRLVLRQRLLQRLAQTVRSFTRSTCRRSGEPNPGFDDSRRVAQRCSMGSISSTRTSSLVPIPWAHCGWQRVRARGARYGKMAYRAGRRVLRRRGDNLPNPRPVKLVDHLILPGRKEFMTSLLSDCLECC